MRTAELEAALRQVTVWPVALDPDPRLVPLPELLAGGLVDRLCARLSGAPRRVGESALVMGLAARLWSLTVVPWVTHGLVVAPDTIRARDGQGSLVLGVASLVAVEDCTVPELHELVLGVLRPVIEALSPAPRLQWGNVAASLHAVPRVHRLPAATPVVAELLRMPPYAGELDLLPGGGERRRTCCLFYLVPGAGLCGDCVLTARTRRFRG